MGNLSKDELEKAIKGLDESVPYYREIIGVLVSAHVEAVEQDFELEQDGVGHLRNFLKTTPFGLSILALARAINKG